MQNGKGLALGLLFLLGAMLIGDRQSKARFAELEFRATVDPIADAIASRVLAAKGDMKVATAICAFPLGGLYRHHSVTGTWSCQPIAHANRPEWVSTIFLDIYTDAPAVAGEKVGAVTLHFGNEGFLESYDRKRGGRPLTK